jgi:DNA polymerase III subunit alpha
MFLARSYSHYSLLSAIPKIPNLIIEAKNKGYTSIALTDEDTTSGWIEFYECCKKNDIKPIMGVTLRISNLSRESDSTSFRNIKTFSKISLLAKDQLGYKHILELLTLARTEKEKPDFHIDINDLIKKIDINNKRLHFFVCLCGNEHELVQAIRNRKLKIANSILEQYTKNLPKEDIILELANQKYNETKDEIIKLNKVTANLCDECKVNYLASPAPRYFEQDEEETFKVVLAIKKQVKIYDIELERDFSMPSTENLSKNFGFIPKSLNFDIITNQINVEIKTDYDKYAKDAFFPEYKLNESENYPDRLIYNSYIGLMQKLSANDEKQNNEIKSIYPYTRLKELIEDCKSIIPNTSKLLGYPKGYWQKKSITDYIDRVNLELEIIISKGFSSYFLVYADIMRFCLENSIVYNTRGSAAGSLVGYLTGINILDPLVYDLPFERFLNPFRPSAPDIDGDFEDDRREEVIQYLCSKYGKDKVCQIVTFGTMLPRAAVRDIGRVLGISYRKCDQLSKLIPTAPQGRKTSFKWAFETSNEFKEVYEKDQEVQRIVDIAKGIEGNYRHASVHAAGVIITPTKLTDYCALQWDSDHKMMACQFDMRTAEKVGLIKLDILGITNLSILGKAVRITEKRIQQKINLYNLDLTDSSAFKLLSNGQTMGLFQLSGAVMTKYLVQLEPRKVEDLMAMVALYRPGAMANIPEYIKRKNNPKEISYMVPKMKEWMEPSYGILVYQDDLLYTAIYLAGYNWDEVDVLRKGMGKKIKEVIDSQHIKFVAGCQTFGGLTKEKAEEIWEIIVPFSAYGFNKAHSANYGMVAYLTAFMKANYPAEFMTSLMTSEEGDAEKIASAIRECEGLGIKVRPPDINLSDKGYSIENNTTIRYGLGSVKNLDKKAIDFIINNRNENGDYVSLSDFLQRISNYPSFNKRSLEALIFAGALDKLGEKEIA